jgi:sugar (pentulose or hexulose) kinase
MALSGFRPVPLRAAPASGGGDPVASTGARIVAVLDIGKTHAKVALVDLTSRTEIATRRIPNASREDGPYPHYAVETIWEFVLDSLAELGREAEIDALSVAAHGAAAALIEPDGRLALPVLDWECPGPDELRAAYDAVRPEFSEGFSPRLPAGLNLGAQLFWQARRFPDAFARTHRILTYAQYWSFRLCGVAAAEITSLACHTDLWNYETDLYSSLVIREGWLDKMPEVRRADSVLGVVGPDLAHRLGLGHTTPVYCGIRDSSASLLPHLIGAREPFAVVSTGTWISAAAPGAEIAALDPTRNGMADIDVFGHHLPACRFLGGREYHRLVPDGAPRATEAAIARVLSQPVMLLPSLSQGTGPFPDRQARWSVPEATLSREMIAAAAAFYLAMMTAECLSLAGADGETSVEGPLAKDAPYLEMLAAATARPVLAMRGRGPGTAIGAALLTALDDAGPIARGIPIAPREHAVAAMVRYAEAWRQAVRQG